MSKSNIFSFSIVYVATGASYVEEAVFSASLTNKILPDIPIHLVTDIESSQRVPESSPFNYLSILEDPSFSYRDKIAGLLDLPYDHILFLDSDAFVSHDLSTQLEEFYLFDLCASYAPCRIPKGWVDDSVPAFFPELNSGVIFFKNTSVIKSLFSSWLCLYDKLFNKYNQLWDQASLRSTLWKYTSSGLIDLNILPIEYNFRLTKPWIAGRGLYVYIIHGRIPHDELSLLTDYLNSNINCFRTFSEWYLLYPKSKILLKYARKSSR